eukprot:Pgem_evm1s11070
MFQDNHHTQLTYSEMAGKTKDELREHIHCSYLGPFITTLIQLVIAIVAGIIAAVTL